MTQEEFEGKWHNKIVKPLGGYYQIPIKEYWVTAALLNYEDDVSIFAIKALDYSQDNKHWFTIRMAEDELEERLADFEIVEKAL